MFNIHSVRVLGVSILDVIGTIIGGILLARWRNWDPIITCVVLLLSSIIVHKSLGIKTQFTEAE